MLDIKGYPRSCGYSWIMMSCIILFVRKRSYHTSYHKFVIAKPQMRILNKRQDGRINSSKSNGFVQWWMWFGVLLDVFWRRDFILSTRGMKEKVGIQSQFSELHWRNGKPHYPIQQVCQSWTIQGCLRQIPGSQAAKRVWLHSLPTKEYLGVFVGKFCQVQKCLRPQQDSNSCRGTTHTSVLPVPYQLSEATPNNVLSLLRVLQFYARARRTFGRLAFVICSITGRPRTKISNEQITQSSHSLFPPRVL